MGRTVIRGGDVFDVDTAAASQAVVIEDGRIAEVVDDAAFTPAPSDEIIDATGATVLAGMVQAHWHGSYDGLDFEPPPVGLERPPGYLMLLAARNARRALARGFTSVIGAATGDALDAQLRDAIADGVAEGPRIIPCGRWLITTGDSNDLPDFWWWGITSPGSQRICDGADEFRKGVRREILEGAEIVKVFLDSGHALLYGSEFVSMTDDELHAAVEAAHHRGKKIRCHVTATANIHKCIEAGVDVLDHCDGMDAATIDAMVTAGTFVCPSLYLTRAIIDRLEADGQGAEPFVDVMKRDLDNMCRMLPEAVAAGVNLLVGDDWGTTMTPHGEYGRELELYVREAGIAPAEVLRWATVNGARCMGLDSELGSVSAGKLADLVVVRGDPTRDISVLGDPANIVAVLKEGARAETAR